MDMQFTADNAGALAQTATPVGSVAVKHSVSARRAELVAAFARELPGAVIASNGDIHVPVSVLEFEQAIRARHGSTHPELVYRTDSTLERARLERPQALQHIAKVILRQGAPRRSVYRGDGARQSA
jgi:hypothetical protein